ncbi:restriction endonuclease subunit S [Tropicibacter sp. S64]|uniref:restriction endonuclease subunit S n=1 Tax=Tropicibacter sp. S64 TaxID=3415122 RepID=UPI003C7A440D
MSWREIQLGDAFTIKHGFAFKSEYFGDEGQHVVLTPGNFYEPGGFRARPGKDRFYTVEPPEDFILAANDLIVAMTEQGEGLLGSSALVPGVGSYLHNQRIGLVENLDEAKLDKGYLYRLFNTPIVRGHIRATASGTKVRHTAPKRIYSIKVKVPPVSEQRRIADILSAYDDLIENNRRRIAFLEEAARLLYREWFVHFRFPGHEHVPITDGLPNGWERFALSDLADFINGFAFKPAHLGDTGLPIVKIPELKQGVTEKTPRNDGEMVPEKYHLKDGDLLFSWSGTLAVNVWTSGPALLNQHLFHVVPRGRVSRAFLMCAIREALIAFENQTVGATMKHIRRSALDRVFVPLPDRAFMSPVEDTLANTFEQLIILHQQNQRLAQARDLLLPRLMNGEIAV